MTAPARIPTPGDLAHRHTPAAQPARQARTRKAEPRPPLPRRRPYVRQTLTVEQAIAPGGLKPWEHFRPFYRFGMTISRMPAHARLVGHDLLWRANHRTGRIDVADQPPAQIIAEATGLTVPQVLVAVQVLHSRGWLVVRHLRSGAEAFDLVIPAGFLEEVRVLRSLRPSN